MCNFRRGAVTLLEALVAIAIVSVLLALLVPAIQKVRTAGERLRCGNNMRQIGIGIHQFHDTHHTFPSGFTPPPGPMSYMGWPARILPFVERSSDWAEVLASFARQPDPWRPNPHLIARKSIPIYICPADGRVFGLDDRGDPRGGLHYLGNAGNESQPPNGVLHFSSSVSMSEVTDGTSHTLMIGERPFGARLLFGWWYVGYGQQGDGSADFYLRSPESARTPRTPTCPRGPYHFGPGDPSNDCDTFHFWSRHPSGANFLFVDGSVRLFRYSGTNLIPQLASRNGGEAVSSD